MSAPSRLRVEHLDNQVLGLGDRRPRLSWYLPDRASHQLAYCVEVNGRALDRIEARESVLVPWPDEPLTDCEVKTVIVFLLPEYGWPEPLWGTASWSAGVF